MNVLKLFISNGMFFFVEEDIFALLGLYGKVKLDSSAFLFPIIALKPDAGS